jgi:hypothetical protein
MGVNIHVADNDKAQFGSESNMVPYIQAATEFNRVGNRVDQDRQEAAIGKGRRGKIQIDRQGTRKFPREKGGWRETKNERAVSPT